MCMCVCVCICVWKQVSEQERKGERRSCFHLLLNENPRNSIFKNFFSLQQQWSSRYIFRKSAGCKSYVNIKVWVVSCRLWHQEAVKSIPADYSNVEFMQISLFAWDSQELDVGLILHTLESVGEVPWPSYGPNTEGLKKKNSNPLYMSEE